MASFVIHPLLQERKIGDESDGRKVWGYFYNKPEVSRSPMWEVVNATHTTQDSPNDDYCYNETKPYDCPVLSLEE